MKRIMRCFMSMSMLLVSMALSAQSAGDSIGSKKSEFKIRVGMETRVDFDYNDVKDGENNSGFHGRYLNVLVDGDINRQLSFHFKQRLNKFGEMRNDVFGATDWVYIDYRPTQNWTVSAGKQVVGIGGFEYDRSPIDIYYASIFWNNIACYQFGFSGAYHTYDGRHTVMAQMCNSPYQPIGKSCFAYNLMWLGKMGWYSTIWSVNLIEYARGRYANFIALGNRFSFPRGYFEFDYTNRYSGHQTYLFGDFTVIGKVCYSIGKFDIFAKGGYDCYRPELGVDATVDKPFYGMGVEFFPLKGSRNLRLHLVGDVTHDLEGNRTTTVSAGLKWAVNLYSKN